MSFGCVAVFFNMATFILFFSCRIHTKRNVLQIQKTAERETFKFVLSENRSFLRPDRLLVKEIRTDGDRHPSYGFPEIRSGSGLKRNPGFRQQHRMKAGAWDDGWRRLPFRGFCRTGQSVVVCGEACRWSFPAGGHLAGLWPAALKDYMENRLYQIKIR